MNETIERLIYAFNPHWSGIAQSQDLYINRELLKDVIDYLDEKQILCLLGPRRTGKTTILKQVIIKLLKDFIEPKNIFYFSFDELMSADHELLEEILQYYFDTIVTNKKERCYILLDEIQYVDYWQTILKRYYDLFQTGTKFLVTGSASVWIKRKSTESLAGRINDFTLWPLSFNEFLKFSGVKLPELKVTKTYFDLEKNIKKLLPIENKIIANFKKYLLFGGFPEIVTEDWDLEKSQNYIRTYVLEKSVLRDLAQYFPVNNPRILVEILQIIAWQSSALFEINNLAQTLNLNRVTVSKYLSYLELGYLISFSYNFTKSRVKQVRSLKKVYLIDTGLITTLTYSGEDIFAHPEELGRIVETSVRNHFSKMYNCYFWRDGHKNEVDIILRRGKSLIPIEVKYSDNVSNKDMKTLRSFMDRFNLKNGIITTRSTFKKLDNIWAVPTWLLLVLDKKIFAMLS